MAANALPGVLHAIAQRRPTAHFRAGDDTAELKDPTAAARSSISSCQIPLLNLSLLAGCSLIITVFLLLGLLLSLVTVSYTHLTLPTKA